MVKTDADPRRSVTVLIDAWPYTHDEIEHAVYSALNVADDVKIVVPDLLLPYSSADFSGLPVEVLRLPFWGTFTTVSNLALAQVATPWAILMHGNEEFQASDASRVLDALAWGYPGIFRLVVATGSAGQILAEPVRILPILPLIRFSGRIWPQIAGSLIEYGYPVQSLAGHLYRLENRASTVNATRRLRSELTRREELSPRAWRVNVALAVLSWAEHRYDEVRQRLTRVPHGASLDGLRIASGVGAIALLEQGRPEEAWHDIQRALARHPKWAELWAIAGQAAMARSRWEDAMRYFAEATHLSEEELPHMEPGYATVQARLRYAEAELHSGLTRPGLARLLALIEDYPSYRAAWQAVLGLLRGTDASEIFSTITTVIAPSKIRHFFSLLEKPTDDERTMKEWLETCPIHY